MGNDEAIMFEADRLVIPILLICIQQLIHTHFEFLRNQAFGHPKIDSLVNYKNFPTIKRQFARKNIPGFIWGFFNSHMSVYKK